MGLAAVGVLDLGMVPTAKGGTLAEGPGSGWYTAAGWIGGIWVLYLGMFVVFSVKSREPHSPVIVLVLLTHMPAASVLSVAVLWQVDEAGRHRDSAWVFIVVGLVIPTLLWLMNRAGWRGELARRAARATASRPARPPHPNPHVHEETSR
ncbi:hypothetical protein [Streptomyces yaizuensis]|uniref:Integral membrane protein n=1 Tax=Streptomyces yaizuensis TaxID=2989713 RepID=A0ABQ5PAB6_9ACTN|nr:hypothetical protein [Streptomyces sp. YSPA8]GLF99443.1 hypothetical protein SYYSPA8_34120 [Streptomyces sp. YSPA8]